MLDRLSGFDWDEHNISHIAMHAVRPAEVEEVTAGRYVIVPAMSGSVEKRWKLFGKTAAVRYLIVVFTIRHNRFRAVTAHTMNRRERKIYGPEID